MVEQVEYNLGLIGIQEFSFYIASNGSTTNGININTVGTLYLSGKVDTYDLVARNGVSIRGGCGGTWSLNVQW
jgi:hypothetical protein